MAASSAIVPCHSSSNRKRAIVRRYSAHSFLVATAATVDRTLVPTVTFEPVIPDTPALVGFAAIILLSALAVYVWANQVVPVSRTNLAMSKSLDRSETIGTS
jgi:hypothetical protein